MNFKHPLLAKALSWKFNDMPGMTTRDNSLVGWPTEPAPTDQELEAIVTEFIALPPTDKAKDRTAWLRQRIQNASTVSDLKLILSDII